MSQTQKIKRARFATPIIGALTFACFSIAPAQAQQNSNVSYAPPKLGHPKCVYGGKGDFYATGDIFTSEDTCADGGAAVLLVDAKPYHSGWGYDFAIWDHNGANNGPTSVGHNITEGTPILVVECNGTYSTKKVSTCDDVWQSGEA